MRPSSSSLLQYSVRIRLPIPWPCCACADRAAGKVDVSPPQGQQLALAKARKPTILTVRLTFKVVDFDFGLFGGHGSESTHRRETHPRKPAGCMINHVTGYVVRCQGLWTHVLGVTDGGFAVT